MITIEVIIYRILNEINKKSYIGSTEFNFNARYTQGQWWKYTHSHHLKLAVERYGLENFSVSILWEGDASKNELIDLERKYIDENNSMIPCGYNLIYGGKSSKAPTNVKSYHLIDLNGKEYKVFNLRKFSRENGLNYGAMLNMVSGIWPQSQGFALYGFDPSKINNPNQTWILKNVKSGETAVLEKGKVHKWAISQSLDPDLIEKVVNGSTKISQNWKLESTEENNTGKKYQDIILVNRQGEEIIVHSIYQFCKENNLPRTSFYDLISGKAQCAYGWMIKDRPQKKRIVKSAILISPSGEEFIVENVLQFSRENNLNNSSVYAIIKGKRKSYKGWTIKKES